MARRAVMVVAVLVFLGAAPTAAANRAAPPAAASCPPGTTPIAPVAQTVRPDGGTDTYYDVDHDGSLTDVPTPPASFEPLLASDADLASYGFPPRPADGDSLASWSADLTGWKPSTNVGQQARRRSTLPITDPAHTRP
jgi:hypothetical protein